MNNTTRRALALVPLAAATAVTAFAQEFGDETASAGPLPNMTDLAAGDFDADGDLDVVAVGSSFNGITIVWCENTGGTALLPQRTLATGAQVPNPRDVAVGDLDGDGDDDIAFSGSGTVEVGWIESLGDGTFGAPQTIDTGSQMGNGIELADLDGDGRIDIVLTRGSTSLTWMRNLGGGSFAPEAILATPGGFYYDMAVVDIDGDGDPDVLGANRSNDRIEWVENLGGGAFAPFAVLASGIDRPLRLEVADLDSDGDLDLGVTEPYLSAERTHWLENRGALNFGPAISFGDTSVLDFTFADVDGDGRADAVVSRDRSEALVWHRNTTVGGTFGFITFGPATTLSVTHRAVRDIVATDLDGDGDVDVAAANVFRLETFEQSGGAFTEGRSATIPIPTGLDVASGDIDGDGLADIAVASDPGRSKVSWHRGIGEGRFSGELETFNLILAAQVEVVDLDGDGDNDIVASGGSYDAIWAGVIWGENLGGGAFAPRAELHGELADSGATFSLGDLEGDGDLDVFLTHREGFSFAQRYQWVAQVAPGVFAPGPTLPNNSQRPRFQLADIDMDGDADLVTWDFFGSATIEWAENDGTGTFGAGQVIRPGTGLQISGIDVGDISGDGLPDVLVFGQGGVEWYLAQPGGTFIGPRVIELTSGSQIDARLFDGNGDGRLDVFVASGAASARWYRNVGAGSFAPTETIAGSGGSSSVVALVDVDGDLDADVLKRRADGGLAFNRGQSRFGDAICGPANPNSTGAWGAVSARGSTLVTDNDVTLLVERLPVSTFGFFLIAPEQDFVPVVPGSQGSLCLGGAIGRLNRGPAEIFRTGIAGAAAVRLDLTNVPTPSGAISLMPGETRYVQAWHRDANPGVTSNFTNGLRVTFE